MSFDVQERKIEDRKRGERNRREKKMGIDLPSPIFGSSIFFSLIFLSARDKRPYRDYEFYLSMLIRIDPLR
jgi:hypothetical protein